MSRFVLASSVVAAFACVASAQQVVPSGYVHQSPPEGQAQGGTFNYFDDTGTQLIDGILGANDWTADLGNGQAQEWVGWRFANPTIDFSFASPVSVTRVEIGLNRTENAGIYIPSTVTIAGSSTTLPFDLFADGNRAWVAFDVSLAPSSTLALTLADVGSSRWIFVDEVRFYIPEPTSLLALATLVPLSMRRR
jgi:hypothetical protein